MRSDAELWALLEPLSDRELCRLQRLLWSWEEMGSRVVAYTDEHGRWVDVPEETPPIG